MLPIPNEGFMLLFNGSTTANQRAWYKTISVVAGNTYNISAMVRGDRNDTPAVLTWNINGTDVGSTVTVNNSLGKRWHMTMLLALLHDCNCNCRSKSFKFKK